MRLDITLSLPGCVESADAKAQIAPLFAAGTEFAIKSLDYEYIDFYSVQTGVPLSTTVSIIAWAD